MSVEFNYLEYYKRCIDYGWGFNSAAQDVWGKPVLRDAQIESLIRMEADKRPGWKAPLIVEVDPYVHLRAAGESKLWDSVFDKFRKAE